MENIVGGCIFVLLGLYTFLRKEYLLESQQRFYEKIFGRRLKSVNMTMYWIFATILTIIGFLILIASLTRIV